MNQFEKVNKKEFYNILEVCNTSGIFKKQFTRLVPFLYKDDEFEEDEWTGFSIYRGDLNHKGNLFLPGYCTLIIGNVNVDGLFSARNNFEDGFDEGGLLIVLGNITCNHFESHYGKCTFIDGNLYVKEILHNAFEDSSLIITGNLKTKFFYGMDIWAETGGKADMDYGIGYCLPVGYKHAGKEAVSPKHNQKESFEICHPCLFSKNNPEYIETAELSGFLTEGKTIFGQM